MTATQEPSNADEPRGEESKVCRFGSHRERRTAFRVEHRRRQRGGGNIALHPLIGGALATMRFTASAGTYTLAGNFEYSYLSSSDVYITLNNATYFTSSFTLAMAVDDYLDFFVGTGGNG